MSRPQTEDKSALEAHGAVSTLARPTASPQSGISAAELRARLRESPELMALVREAVARNRRQGKVDFSDEWREALANDLAQFND